MTTIEKNDNEKIKMQIKTFSLCCVPFSHFKSNLFESALLMLNALKKFHIIDVRIRRHHLSFCHQSSMNKKKKNAFMCLKWNKIFGFFVSSRFMFSFFVSNRLTKGKKIDNIFVRSQSTEIKSVHATVLKNANESSKRIA